MRKKVLIVEDEIFVALEIEQIVEDAGFGVGAIAADRAAALAHARDCDIALVDLNLRDGPTGPQIGMELASQHGASSMSPPTPHRSARQPWRRWASSPSRFGPKALLRRLNLRRPSSRRSWRRKLPALRLFRHPAHGTGWNPEGKTQTVGAPVTLKPAAQLTFDA